MKLSKENKTKKDFSDNHRQNYQAYNKSSIFDTPVSKTNSSGNVNKAQTLARTKTKSTFVPKFNEESAFNRKLKEFWTKDEYMKDYGTTTTSVGFLEKEDGQNQKRDKSLCNAKERRIFDMHPTSTVEDVKKMTRATSFYEKNSYSERKNTENAREKRLNDMNSNIFNDPDKTEEMTLKRNKSVFVKRDVLKALEDAEEAKKKKAAAQKSFNKNKSKVGLGTKATSLNINTELVERKTKNSEENYSASNMKRKQMTSFFDSDDKKKAMTTATPKAQKEESKANEVISQRFGPGTKTQKLSNLASSFQSKEFYAKSYSNVDKQNRTTDNYEIVTKNGFDKLEPQEIKYLFTRKGIHIYDFQEKGKYHDGFKSGNISFKIRKNDDPEFKGKLTEINQKINNLGMKLVPVSVNTKRPMTELVPNGLAWNDTQLNKITNGRIEKNPNPKIKRLKPNDKYANQVIQTDSSYKNPYSRKKNMNSSKSVSKV